MAKVVEHGDCLDDSADRFLAEGCDPRRHHGKAADQVLAKIIVKFANAQGLGIHRFSPFQKGRDD
jgi:hypothetical protein